MSDEQPVTIKKRRVAAPEMCSDSKVCIVHYNTNCGDLQVRPLTERSFNTIRHIVQIFVRDKVM